MSSARTNRPITIENVHMDNPLDDIDEVALNALLAQDVDLPTALEASRWDSNSSRPGCILVLLLIVAVPGAVAVVVL